MYFYSYGYAHNGYQYDPPKFMFYPYSQQNIGNNANKNFFLTGDGKTEVSIEPSYSYELNPQSYIAHNEPQIDVPKAELQKPAENFQPQQIHNQQQQYEEPVIVLRIPGPAKYASHLQMLLQKYLEIRAAQYLRILEEAEQRNNQQHQLQQLDYGHGNNAITDSHVENIEQHQPHASIPEQHDYQQQVQYEHQIAVTPPPVQYPEIDNVYHNYKHRHPSQPEQVQQPFQDTQNYFTPQQSGEQQNQHEYQPQYQQQEQHQYQQQEQHQFQQQDLQQSQYQQDQPQFYYSHQQQYAQPEGPPANTYQNVYLLSMQSHGQTDYESSQVQQEKQQPIYVQDQQNQNEQSSSLPIAENNPRPSHTKVVFNNNNEHSNQDYQMYQLPSIQPNERHAPTSVPDYHQDFQQQQQQQQFQNLQGKQDSQENSLKYQQHYNTQETPNPEVVAITQKPFNYHAHNVKARARGRTAHSRRAASPKDADKGLQKIRDFVRDKLGAETGSAVEFKTTQVIDG